MAIRTAVATGNWSNPATWDGGVSIPAPGDTVRASTFVVTIDQDVNVAALESNSSGLFSCSTARVIAANLSNPGTATCCLNTTNVGGVTVTVVGNITGGTGLNNRGVYHQGAGILSVTGNVTGGSGTEASGITNVNNGTVNITGNVTGGNSTSGYGVRNATGTVNVTGNVTGGAGIGLINTGSGVVNIVGSAIGGAGAASYGASNNAANGVMTASVAIGNNFGPGGGSAMAAGISGWHAAGNSTRVYRTQDGPYGMTATNGAVRLIKDPSNIATFLCSDSTTRSLVPAVSGGGVGRTVFPGIMG